MAERQLVLDAQEEASLRHYLSRIEQVLEALVTTEDNRIGEHHWTRCLGREGQAHARAALRLLEPRRTP